MEMKPTVYSSQGLSDPKWFIFIVATMMNGKKKAGNLKCIYLIGYLLILRCYNQEPSPAKDCVQGVSTCQDTAISLPFSL